jgi:ATP-dependent DNA helicase RecG
MTQLPFQLTTDQSRAIDTITQNMTSGTTMNRLLVGDVGSGKTVVAFAVAAQVLAAGKHAFLIAPTQVLAEQHAQTAAKLFPSLCVTCVMGGTTTRAKAKTKAPTAQTPTLWIGTHALFAHLPILKPALVMYDEQHRFGVAQRSRIQDIQPEPHLLTLTATPIPRSLMLTIFRHLDLTTITTLPPGRLPTKSWVVPPAKQEDALGWIRTTLVEKTTNTSPRRLCIVVCPFIEPSKEEAFAHIASATRIFAELHTRWPSVALLHGRQPKTAQHAVLQALRKGSVDVLVTTPIVEVGIDLPTADILVIHNAERFGLASLHQLRGRVGRANQQGYCVLFSHSTSSDVQQRLRAFTQTHNGQELAELDLQHRGAGDLFGTDQHGFDQLRFASWTNATLIGQAKQLYDTLKTSGMSWSSPLAHLFTTPHNESVLAN